MEAITKPYKKSVTLDSSKNIRTVTQFIINKSKQHIFKKLALEDFWEAIYYMINYIKNQNDPCYFTSSKKEKPNNGYIKLWSTYNLNYIEPFLKQIFINKSETKILIDWIERNTNIHEQISNTNYYFYDKADYLQDEILSLDDDLDKDQYSVSERSIDICKSNKNDFLQFLDDSKLLILILVGDRDFQTRNEFSKIILSEIEILTLKNTKLMVNKDNSNEIFIKKIFMILEKNKYYDEITHKLEFWINDLYHLLEEIAKLQHINYKLKVWIKNNILNPFYIRNDIIRQPEKLIKLNKIKCHILALLDQSQNKQVFKNYILEEIKNRMADLSNLDYSLITRKNRNNQLDEKLDLLLSEICSFKEIANKLKKWVENNMLIGTLGKKHEINMLCNLFGDIILDKIEEYTKGPYPITRNEIFCSQGEKLTINETQSTNTTIDNTTPLVKHVSTSTIYGGIDDLDDPSIPIMKHSNTQNDHKPRTIPNNKSYNKDQFITKVNNLFQDEEFIKILNTSLNTINLVIDKIKQNKAIDSVDNIQTADIDQTFYQILRFDSDVLDAIRRLCQYQTSGYNWPWPISSLLDCINYNKTPIDKLKRRLEFIASKDFLGIGSTDLEISGVQINSEEITTNINSLNDELSLENFKHSYGISLQIRYLDVKKIFNNLNKFIDLSDDSTLINIYLDIGKDEDGILKGLRGCSTYYNKTSGMGDQKLADDILESFKACFVIEKAITEPISQKDNQIDQIQFIPQKSQLHGEESIIYIKDDKVVLNFLAGYQNIFGHHTTFLNQWPQWLVNNTQAITFTLKGLNKGTIRSYTFSDDNKQITIKSIYPIGLSHKESMFTQQHNEHLIFIDTFKLKRKYDNKSQVRLKLVKSLIQYDYTRTDSSFMEKTSDIAYYK